MAKTATEFLIGIMETMDTGEGEPDAVVVLMTHGDTMTIRAFPDGHMQTVGMIEIARNVLCGKIRELK